MIRRLPHIIVALLAFALFFLWGTKATPWLFFTAFWPMIHILYGVSAALLMILLFAAPDASRRFFNGLVRLRYFIIPPLAGIATLFITVFVFQNIPHVIDAAHFLWTARLMQEGAISLPAGDLYEYTDVTFMVRDGGIRYSLFLPGFSLFLALFDTIGAASLLVPLCTGLSVWLTGRIADKFFNSRVSLLAMALCTVSSFYLFMGASFMTHNFNLFLVMLAVWLVVRDPHSYRGLIIASLALAITFFVRPQNAVFSYLPLGIFLLVKRVGITRLIAFAFPAVLGAGGLLLFNHAMTGNPLLFPQDLYFSIIEPVPHCHRIGMGTGCPNTEGKFLPPEGLTLDYAYWVTYTRLTLMLFNVTGHPYIFLFLALSFLFSLRRGLFLASFFLSFFAGYFFFYLPGNLFGPRYFTEVTMLLLIPAAFGIVMITRKTPRRFRPLIAAFPLAGMLFIAGIIMPELLERYSDRFWTTDRSFEEAITQKGITQSVVFVPATYHAMLLNTQTRPPFDDHGNLIVKDLGRENLYGAAYFMEKYALKNAYVIDYYPKLRNLTVVEELAEFRLNDMWIEFENKGRPLSGKPAYATPVSVGFKLTHLPFAKLDENLDFSNDRGYTVLFGALSPDSYYDISHPILDPGTYELTVDILGAPCGGSFSLTVNDAPVLDFSAFDEEYRFQKVQVSAPLTAGNNRISFVPRTGQSCLILDYIRLRKVEEEAPVDYPDYTPPEWEELNR